MIHHESSLSLSSLARDLAVIFLYKCEARRIYFFSPTHFSQISAAHLGADLSSSHRRKVRSLARHHVRQVYQHFAELIRILDRQSQNWSFARLQAVDKAILLLAARELMYEKTPKAVVISEAITLARTYSTSQSSSFIHGILGAIAADHEDDGRDAQDGLSNL